MPTLVNVTKLTSLSGSIASTTAGNCLVVCVMSKISGTSTGTVSGITLGGGADNFASARAAHGTDGFTTSCDAIVWYDKNCAGSQTALVISGSNLTLTNEGVIVFEFSGVDTSAPLDLTNAGNGASTAWSSGATGTLTQANEVIVGCVASGTAVSAPGAPWTNETGLGTNCGSGYQIVSATTSQTYNGTNGVSSIWAAVVITLKASTSVTGTGSVALGGLAFRGSGSIPGGGLTLGGVAFSGSGSLNFTGSGSLGLGGLAFSGSQTTVAPVIPTEPAGVVATSNDQNSWANAASFFLGSSKGTKPVFLLMASATQALTTSFTAVTFSSSAAVFKDNQGGFAGGTPSRYTIGLAGFYVISYNVSAASGAGRLQAYAQVTTTASNPFNPSTTVKFCSSHRAATTNLVVASSGGVVPIYLAVGDYIEVYALVGSAVSTSLTLPPQFNGEWVSE